MKGTVTPLVIWVTDFCHFAMADYFCINKSGEQSFISL